MGEEEGCLLICGLR